MKKIINKKVYDTEKAILIAEYCNGLMMGDFNFISEDLYKSKNGQFFLHAIGGPNTIYSESSDNTRWGIETIILLNTKEAYEWLEKRNESETIEKYFLDMISEG